MSDAPLTTAREAASKAGGTEHARLVLAGFFDALPLPWVAQHYGEAAAEFVGKMRVSLVND